LVIAKVETRNARVWSFVVLVVVFRFVQVVEVVKAVEVAVESPGRR
jgi:hypothetical protein